LSQNRRLSINGLQGDAGQWPYAIANNLPYYLVANLEMFNIPAVIEEETSFFSTAHNSPATSNFPNHPQRSLVRRC